MKIVNRKKYKIKLKIRQLNPRRVLRGFSFLCVCYIQNLTQHITDNNERMKLDGKTN